MAEQVKITDWAPALCNLRHVTEKRVEHRESNENQ